MSYTKLVKFLSFVIVAQSIFIVYYLLWNKCYDLMLDFKATNINGRVASQISFPRKTFNPTVLFWTTYYLQQVPLGADLYFSSDCLFTNNRSYLPQAQLVIFFLPNLNVSDLPPSRDPSQLWVLWTHDPPHTDAQFGDRKRFPWFYKAPVFDWLYFNLTFTYRPDSDIPLPYGKVIPRRFPPPVDQMTELKQAAKHKIEKIRATNATAIAWLVSNCVSNNQREMYVAQLRQLIPVDIYGKCGSRHCGTRMDRRCYEMIEKKYLFYLSFENSLCEHYVSEKAFNILSYNLVPITYGGANYSSHLPSHSYIDATSKSPDELATYLKSLLNNSDEQYLEFLNWKSHYEVVDSFFVHWSPKIKGLTEYVSVAALGNAIQSHLKWDLSTNNKLSMPKPIHNGTEKSLSQFLQWRNDEYCFSKFN